MESAIFKDYHSTPTAFLTNFTKTVKLTIGDETAFHETTSKNRENYWKVDFQIDILEEAC